VDDPSIQIVHGNTTVKFESHHVLRLRTIAGRAIKTLTFNCGAGGIPNVCQNMCYGIKCKGLPSVLTKGATGSSCTAARKRNQCGAANPNPCSSKVDPTKLPKEFSCDEYPFASSLQGQSPAFKAVTRCVPFRQNSVQGGKISGIYKTLNPGDQIQVDFDFGGQPATLHCAATSAASPECLVFDSEQLDK